MNKKDRKEGIILIAAGGTGGHIYPAESFFAYCREQGRKIIFLTDARYNNYYTQIKKEDVCIVSSGRLIKNIKIIGELFKIFFGILQSLKAIKDYKVEKVVLFGGYPVLPILIASLIMKKPVVLHEQNQCIGRVNHMFLRWAKYLAVSFEMQNISEKYKGNSSKYGGSSGKYKEKIVHTGLPLRAQLMDYSSAYNEEQKQEENAEQKQVNVLGKGINHSLFKILVIGGSQGSKIFAHLMLKVIEKLPQEIRDQIFLIQQIKKDQYQEVKDQYEKLNFHHYQLSPFFENIEEYLGLSDIVISRAGASSVFEAMYLEKVAILIPFKYAVKNHQLLNAKYITDRNMGILIEEDEYVIDNLKTEIISFIQDKEKIQKIKQNIKNNKVKLKISNANQNLYKLIE